LSYIETGLYPFPHLCFPIGQAKQFSQPLFFRVGDRRGWHWSIAMKSGMRLSIILKM
jgi:hypothetical protein